MDIVTGTFIDSLPVYAKWIIMALILVIILALSVWVLRRIFNRQAKSDNQGTPCRLAVVEAANIDGHRRMVLIRRDDVEHLVMIGGASDVLIESNIGNTFHSPVAYQQAPQEQPSILEEHVGDTNLQVSEFDDIFSPTDTAELTRETTTQPHKGSSWRDKAGTAAVLSTASLAIDQSDQTDHDDVSSQLSTGFDNKSPNLDPSKEAAEETFSGMTSVLDAELTKSSDIIDENQETNPPSLNSPETKFEDNGSHDIQHDDADAASELPNKQDMEDEMQRLLNELTGEKT